MNPYESRFQDDDDDDDDEPEHSVLGISSFVIACVAGLVEVAVVAFAALLDESADPAGMDEVSPQEAILILGFIGGIFLAVVSVGLGIAGLFQRDRSKTFPALGVVIGALVIAGAVGLAIIGSMTE